MRSGSIFWAGYPEPEMRARPTMPFHPIEYTLPRHHRTIREDIRLWERRIYPALYQPKQPA